jgi:hypothetical protein
VDVMCNSDFVGAPLGGASRRGSSAWLASKLGPPLSSASRSSWRRKRSGDRLSPCVARAHRAGEATTDVKVASKDRVAGAMRDGLADNEEVLLRTRKQFVANLICDQIVLGVSSPTAHRHHSYIAPSPLRRGRAFSVRPSRARSVEDASQ